LALATGLLAAGYAMKGSWGWCVLIAVFGLFWLYAQRLGRGGIGSFGLFFFSVAATRGTFLDIKAGWLLLSVVAALLAWDLDYFLRRLRQAGRVEKSFSLELNHLKRLLAVGGLGLLFGGAALTVKLHLHLGWILLLGVISLFSLSKLINLLSRERE